MKVLVAHGSKYGGTAEIAERIGAVLREAGHTADVLPADRGDPARYDAVVLGSAVYMGQWRRSARKFLRKNEATLSVRPVWLFSSGPTGEGDPVTLMEGWTLPPGLKAVAVRVGPRGITAFHGVIDEARLKGWERWIIRRVGAKTGDFRDWDAITAWARSIAEALRS